MEGSSLSSSCGPLLLLGVELCRAENRDYTVLWGPLPQATSHSAQRQIPDSGPLSKNNSAATLPPPHSQLKGGTPGAWPGVLLSGPVGFLSIKQNSEPATLFFERSGEAVLSPTFSLAGQEGVFLRLVAGKGFSPRLGVSHGLEGTDPS